MAIGTPVHILRTASAATSHTTAAFTPAAASIIYAWGVTRDASAFPNDHTISDSLSLTWTKIGAVSGPATNAFMKGTLFWAISTNTSMTVTVTTNVASGGGTAVEIVTIPMGAPDTSVTATGSSDVGDPSATLASATAAIAFVCAQTGNVFAQSNAYTEIVDSNPTGLTNQLHMCVAYDLTSPSLTCAMTSTNVNTIMFLVSLVEAVAPSPGGGGRLSIGLGIGL